jgi:iron(III) transport system ATP-binding protein
VGTTYIINRVVNGDYGVAIAYCSVLIVLMLAVIGGIQWLVGTRRLGGATRVLRPRRWASWAAARMNQYGQRRFATDRGQKSCRAPSRMCDASASRSDAMIEFRGVTKRYGGRHRRRQRLVRHRRRHARHAARTSGCGKTTILRMLAGLELPSSGTIRIGGEDVTSRPAAERDVSMVFQSYALFPHMSVLENVPLRPRRLGKPRARATSRRAPRSRPWASRASIARLPSELSGGQQQRVAVARALVLEPSVLLFDEPLSNLDARLRRQMREEIRDLQQRLGLTVVYVTHDQSEAMAVSDRIIVMNKASSHRKVRRASSTSSRATRSSPASWATPTACAAPYAAATRRSPT